MSPWQEMTCLGPIVCCWWFYLVLCGAGLGHLMGPHQSQTASGEKIHPREDRCFVLSVNNWLSRMITFIFATESLDSAKYIYAPWQSPDFKISWQNMHTDILLTISSKKKNPIL